MRRYKLGPRALAALAGAFLIAACETANGGATLVEARSQFDAINDRLADAQGVYTDYLAALSSEAGNLAELATQWEDPSRIKDPTLKAQAYFVSAASYYRLADLPLAQSPFQSDPAARARDVAGESAAVCAGLGEYPACQVLETIAASAVSRRAASDLAALSLAPESADKTTVSALLSGFAGTLAGWQGLAQPSSAGDRDKRTAMLTDMICYVHWSGEAFSGQAGLIDLGPRFRTAVSEASAAARLPLCKPGEAVCAADTACREDRDSEACTRGYRAAALRTCGSGMVRP